MSSVLLSGEPHGFHRGAPAGPQPLPGCYNEYRARSYIWTDGLKVAELGNNWNNTRKNGMRIKVRSRGELNGKNNLGFDGNHWPGPTHRGSRFSRLPPLASQSVY